MEVNEKKKKDRMYKEKKKDNDTYNKIYKNNYEKYKNLEVDVRKLDG